MAGETVLSLSGIGVPPYSARGLTQTLSPVDAAIALKRTVNGNLKSVADPVMQKFKSKISGKDVDPPAIDGTWPGTALTVDCIEELSFKTDTGSATRNVVSGSLRVDVETGFSFYRPSLDMIVRTFELNKDEYSDEITWTMELEEE